MFKAILLATLAGVTKAGQPICYANVLPGYSAPQCNTKIASPLHGVQPFPIKVLNAPNPWDPLQSKSLYKLRTSWADTYENIMTKYTDKYGIRAWTLQDVFNSDMGVNEYEYWDPSKPQDCAMLCDLDDACAGFTFKLGSCFLAVDTVIDAGAGCTTTQTNGMVTYWKSSSTQRTQCADSATGPAPQAVSKCDAWYSADEPCTYHAVAASTTNMLEDKFADTDNWDMLLPLDESSNWMGSAPGAFDTSLVSASENALVLDTAHVVSGSTRFTFPATDADCGCSYDTYTSSMVAGKTAVGYGIYEATFSSSATSFVNAFWFQGDSTEINVLKVEGTTATASLHCFADQDNQVADVTTISTSFDVSVDHTVTLSFNKQEVTILIDGEIVMQKDTPNCLKVGNTADGDALTMKPIFSVEVGESLPDVSGKADGESFGSMAVKYFRSWETSFMAASAAAVNNGGVACKSADTSVHSFGGGVYQGPVPKGNGDGKWVAHCGQKLIGARKLKGKRGTTITECGELCEDMPGCVSFWWEKKSGGLCRMYTDSYAQAKLDSAVGASSAGNIWMTKPAVRVGTVDTFQARIPINCPDPVDPTVASGFTKTCFSQPKALGSRAAIDIDQDGVIEFGCPLSRTEFYNSVGNRVSKACTNSHCTGSVCKDGVLPPPFPAAGKWRKAGYHTKDWGGDLGVLGDMTLDTCLKLCARSCSCASANYQPAVNKCILIAKAGVRKFKAIPKSGPNKIPIPLIKYVTYSKNVMDVNATSGKTAPSQCDISALVANGQLPSLPNNFPGISGNGLF